MAPTENEIPNKDKPASELTKREWFAGMILQGVTTRCEGLTVTDVQNIISTADHLLAELENTKEPA